MLHLVFELQNKNLKKTHTYAKCFGFKSKDMYGTIDNRL